MNLTFDQLFKKITPKEIPCDVFTLVGEIFPVITAGDENLYNSMTASGGGFGLLLKKACVWSILRTDRYTLQLMQEKGVYTMSFFSEKYKEQILFLGSESGRDSHKMKKVQLTPVLTPDGNMSFNEAFLIIDCKLVQITKPLAEDFYTPQSKEYISEMYTNQNEQRKYIFGEIVHVWIKK